MTSSYFRMKMAGVIFMFAVMAGALISQIDYVQAQSIMAAPGDITGLKYWPYISSAALAGRGLIDEANAMATQSASDQNVFLYSIQSILALKMPELLPHLLQQAFATAVSSFGADVNADDDSESFQRSEVSITVSPTDPSNLVSVSHRVDLDGPAFTECEFSSSFDMGATWDADGILADPLLFGFEGDPTVATDSTGKHYYSCESFFAHPDNNIFVFSSGDGGITFSNVATAGVAVPSTSDVFHDKPWVIADQNPTSPCADTVYLSYTDFMIFTADIMEVTSTDMGVTWSTPIKISTAPGNQLSYPFVDPVTGDVYVAWLEFGTGVGGSNSIVVAKSTDCGASFTAPIEVDGDVFGSFFEFIDEVFFRAREPPEVQGCVNDDGVQVVWRDFPDASSIDSDIHYSSSPDGSAGSWSAEVVVNAVTDGDQFFPTIHCQNDQAHIAWGDQRADTIPDTGLFDVFYTSVPAAGVFGPELMVTDFTQDATPLGFAHVFEPIAGDYFDSTVNDLAFHVIWTDFRIPDPLDQPGNRFVDKGDKEVIIVGGEMMPIDTSALFVAGAFANAFWILPVLAGIAGAVIAVIRIRTKRAE